MLNLLKRSGIDSLIPYGGLGPRAEEGRHIVAATRRTPRRHPAPPAKSGTTTAPRLSVLTARGFSSHRDTLARGLRKAGINLQTTSSWERLLALPDDEAFDAVLVDLDAAEHAHRSKRSAISGHRLISLLARHLASKPTALVVITSLDFAEVDDLARCGVHAFLTPDMPPGSCAEHLRAAVERLRRCRTRRAPLLLNDAQALQVPLTAQSAESSTLTHP